MEKEKEKEKETGEESPSTIESVKNNVVSSMNNIPMMIAKNTIDLAEYIGGKLDKIADGLTGKGSGDDGSGMMLKKHFEMLERLRRTKPTNYKNLSERALKLSVMEDPTAREAAILKAFV